MGYWGEGRTIALVAYSAAMTVFVFGIATYTFLLRRRYKQGGSSPDVEQPEDLENLYRRSTSKRYEADHSEVYRTPTAPLSPSRNRVVSEYDIDNSASTTKKHTPQPETSEKVNHHYETIKDRKPGNDYEQILDHVASTLSIVYSDTGSKGNVYEKFMVQLIGKIKEQSNSLYESIQEGKQVDEDNDSIYDTYVPLKNGKLVIAEEMGVSFGSSGHLRHLERKISTGAREPFLEQKAYKATRDCPKT